MSDSHVGGHREASFLILQDMVVAIERASESGEIGNHRGDLLQVDPVQRHRKILSHGGVLILRVDLHTCSLIVDQVDMGLNALVTGQEDIVIGVEVELLIANGGAFRQQFDTQALLLHVCRGTDTQAHLVVLVVVAQPCQCPMAMEMTIDETVEHELRVPAVVAHLQLIAQTLPLLREVQADGVNAGTVVVQRVDMTLTVDTSLR